ncbi:unnamed protein product, partial [Amaranthus hypochondriacus]
MDPMINVLDLMDQLRDFNTSFGLYSEFHEVKNRVGKIVQFLERALKILDSMGGLGALDKHVEDSLILGLHRLEYLHHEFITETQVDEHGLEFRRVNYRRIQTIHPIKFLQKNRRRRRFFHPNRKNNIGDGYIKDLAREVLQDLPEFSDPEHEADCLVQKHEQIDRNCEREDIVRLLEDQDTSNPGPVSIVPVLGFAGFGKTSLSMLVYNDIRNRKSFDCQIWIDVSETHSNNLLQIVENGLIKKTASSFSLQKDFQDQKYLIILDDLSELDPRKWFDLF